MTTIADRKSVPVPTVMSGGYAADTNDTVEIHCNTLRAAYCVFDVARSSKLMSD